MGLMQKDVKTSYSRGSTGSYKAKTKKPEDGINITEVHVTTDADSADFDSQDDLQWDQTFAASQDTLAHLAARSRAHREAGRTKRISI